MNNNINKIYNNPLSIRYIENPTKEEMLAAVKKNGATIRFLKSPSFDVKKEAILNNPQSIEYIEELDEELAILAVRLSWNSLKYIKNKTDNILKEAVKTKGWAIQFIKDPSEEVQILAVQKDFDAIKYINNPSEKVQVKAVENYWGAIRFIQNPALEAKRAAVKLDEESINYITKYDIEELKIFISDNVNIVKYVYDSLDIDTVLEIIKEKIAKEDLEYKYMKNFLELEVLEMDKVAFIKENGSKNAKMILIDYKLS